MEPSTAQMPKCESELAVEMKTDRWRSRPEMLPSAIPGPGGDEEQKGVVSNWDSLDRKLTNLPPIRTSSSASSMGSLLREGSNKDRLMSYISANMGEGASLELAKHTDGDVKELPGSAHALHPALRGCEKRVLLIDDSVLILRVMKTTVERLGYTVVTAEDGQAGLIEAKRGMFAVVMCDINLPVLNGFEFVQALRDWEKEQGLETRPRQFVFALSGSEFPRDGIGGCAPAIFIFRLRLSQQLN